MRKILHFGLVLLFILAILGGLGWWQRTPVLCWYSLRGLDAAHGADRESWVEFVVWLDEAAVGGLVDRFGREDAQACENAGAALAALTKQWGLDDPRTAELAERICRRFDEFSSSGQEAALQWQLAALQLTPVPKALRQQAFQILEKAARGQDQRIRQRSLALANVLMDKQPPPGLLPVCETLIARELKNPDAGQRTQAVHLTLHTVFHDNEDLLRQVVPLLGDQSAEVRRAVLLAVGTSPSVLGEEDLLPLLHDSDAETRKLCEAALRSRGLHDGHILLGRLITDQRPAARLKVVHYLPEVEDIDPETWVQRLSQDSSEAVRAAAVRLAAAVPNAGLQKRLLEMAGSDPSETVRQLAQFYLTQMKGRR